MELRSVKYVLREDAGEGQPDILDRAVGEAESKNILEMLTRLRKNTLLCVDFSKIRYIDSVCGKIIAVRAMSRIRSNRYDPERNAIHLCFCGMRPQHRSNLNVPLKSVQAAAIELSEHEGAVSCNVLGYVMDSYQAVAMQLAAVGNATASEIQEQMGYSTVNESSTKLSALFIQGLIAREESGKGRSYRYFSLVQSVKKELRYVER